MNQTWLLEWVTTNLDITIKFGAYTIVLIQFKRTWLLNIVHMTLEKLIRSKKFNTLLPNKKEYIWTIIQGVHKNLNHTTCYLSHNQLILWEHI